MRMFVLLLILVGFFTWFGFYFKQGSPRYARISFIIAGILALLAIGGFYGLF